MTRKKVCSDRRFDLLIPEIRLAVSEASAPSELDVLLAAVGYERRSSFIPLQWAKRSQVRIASAFDSLKVLSYERNCIDLQQAGFHVEEHGESDIRPWLHRQLLEASVNDGPAIRLGVDVSSFSRSRIAQIMLAIIDCASDRDVIADFAYAPAEYRRYQHADAEIRVFGPVAPEFAGWSREPSAPVSCLIGLGYEADRAAGALEFLEPQCVGPSSHPASMLATTPRSRGPTRTCGNRPRRRHRWSIRLMSRCGRSSNWSLWPLGSRARLGQFSFPLGQSYSRF